MYTPPRKKGSTLKHFKQHPLNPYFPPTQGINPMNITVRVFGDISQIIGKRYELDVPEGSTLSTVTGKVGEKSGQRQGYLGEFRVGGKDLAILVNGKNIDMLDGPGTKLKNGDEVVVMQPTAGG